MSSTLIYSDSQTLLANLVLTGEPVRIGRAASCQLRVSDSTVSDEHCMIRQEGNIWVAESLPGAITFLNAQEHPIVRQPLRDRDLLRCGGLWIQFTQDEKDALQGEPAPRSSAGAGDAAQLHKELAEARELAAGLRKSAEQLESELATNKRELSLAQSELAQTSTKLAAAGQRAHDQEAATAHLLGENKSLVAELEHLRTILNHKDQVIEEAREAPQSMMAELVAVRRQCEELTEQRKWLEAERDAAQIELSRRALALAQAEEELRRLRHQSELHERLLATSHNAGAELARAVQHNSSLTIELTQAREKLAAVKEQLAMCLKAISLVVIELGVKVYALRAAIVRQGTSGDADNAKTIHDALEQILMHLNDGNVQLQSLRKLTDEVAAAAPTSAVQALS